MSLTGERQETRRERRRKELPPNRKATESVCAWILTLVLFMRCLCGSVIFQYKRIFTVEVLLIIENI